MQQINPIGIIEIFVINLPCLVKKKKRMNQHNYIN